MTTRLRTYRRVAANDASGQERNYALQQERTYAPQTRTSAQALSLLAGLI